MKLQKYVSSILALVLLMTTAVTFAPAESASSSSLVLPLGQLGLTETRTSRQVAPGVTYTRIVRGEQSAHDVWTVDVSFRQTRREAREVAGQLRTSGYYPRIERIAKRAFDDPTPGPLGFLVRVGEFPSQAEAEGLRDQLIANGYSGLRVIYTGEDGGRTAGPWVVHVLEVDRERFNGTVAPQLGSEVVPGRELLTGIAARTNALAAVTGGYFVIGANDGTPGDLAGISVIDGALVSEAVDGRTSLILPHGNGQVARIAALESEQTLVATDGTVREIDGLNRKPGLIRGCGGDGGDVPTEQPKHDFTCTDRSELILFTNTFGEASEPGDGAEVALDAAGQVIEVRENRGGIIPAGGSVLSGTDEAADWLREHAKLSTRLAIETRVIADGQQIALEAGQGIINGGPRLLRSGRPDITAAAEGFHWPENPEFYYRFGVRRNPRTLAGITKNGKLLLVAVDGRQPGYSVGASFEESARIMQALGAVNAVNLDGGGSTALTIGTELINRPSDATGERPLGDAIVIRP